MDKYTTFVGMDVHARSITCRALVKETGETFSKSFFNCPVPEEIASWLLSLPQPIYCAYESGCTGFHLAKELRKHGIDCDVIAVSTLPRSDKDKKGKCDKIDARVILREILNPLSDYSVVWLPDEETEAARELARARSVAVKNLKQAKQQLTSFLLRHGHVWNEETKSGNRKKRWTKSYWKWVDSVTFNQEANTLAFEFFVCRVNEAQKEVDKLSKLIVEQTQKPEVAPYIDALCHLKGIEAQTAYLAWATFGDFRRFSSGRKVASWAGLTPKNNSSGAKEDHGSITKAGDKYLRRSLIEALGTIKCWKDFSKELPDRKDVSSACKRLASNANKRIYERYHYLVGKNLHTNKARVAVASELVRWIWVIGRQTQLELCKFKDCA